MTENLYSMLNRADLALEAREMVTRQVGPNIPGVRSVTERAPHTVVHRTDILNEEGAHKIGKPVGRYVTLEAPEMRSQDPTVIESIGGTLALELSNVLNLSPDATVLVVGLGNWNATPDALGPRVVDDVCVTRHLYIHMPDVLEPGFRSVAALSPGVLGLTGVETADIIKGVVQNIQPDCVICIDALAARSTDRVSTTIQISNTGINPGSGVGNKRTAITQETMGVPVIAIGVPTVVHAVTLAYDTINLVLQQLSRHKGFEQPLRALTNMNDQQKFQMVNDMLQPYVGKLVVTPKEIDVLIDSISNVISGGINAAVHPGMDIGEAMVYQN